jgi:hypothetical protein
MLTLFSDGGGTQQASVQGLTWLGGTQWAIHFSEAVFCWAVDIIGGAPGSATLLRSGGKL